MSRHGWPAFRAEAVANARFLVKWLALAYLIEGLLATYVPAGMIAGVVGGDGMTPVVMGALVGAPAYLNGYAAPALVAGLMEQGMGPGAAMAFMVAGLGELHPGHGRGLVARAPEGIRRLHQFRHRRCYRERRAVRRLRRLIEHCASLPPSPPPWRR